MSKKTFSKIAAGLQEGITVTRGSGNVFADIGIPNPEEHQLKAHVVRKLGEALKLSPTRAGVLGLGKDDLQAILAGKFRDYPLARLQGMLLAVEARAAQAR